MLQSKDGQIGQSLSLPKARTAALVVRDLPDELLVYDLETGKAHCLNQAAALTWRHCDGRTSVAELAAILSAELQRRVDEDLIWLALGQLSKARLLEEQLAGPGQRAGLSRREVVKKLGLGAAFALPVVVSIVAPSAVSAQTCLTNEMDCSPPGDNNDCCSMCCSASSETCITKGSRGTNAACSVPCACRSNNCVPNPNPSGPAMVCAA